MRTQVHRQRGEFRQLQRAATPTASSEALLERMLTKIDAMCLERDKLKKELGPAKGRVLAKSEATGCVRADCEETPHANTRSSDRGR